MTLVVDHSGRLHTKHKCTMKDLIAHSEVILVGVEGLCGKARLSVYTMQKAILQFYSQCKLFPSGVVSEIPAVQDWAMKMSIAIAKMVSRLRRLMKRSSGSKHKKLTDLKTAARVRGWDHVWPDVKSNTNKTTRVVTETAQVVDVKGIVVRCALHAFVSVTPSSLFLQVVPVPCPGEEPW
ncbi:unnamed protein product [Durusdinium trenchii]|uniref:Uncharacterized protein n=1 Tax=Durusdinium trenchii TaxID=1381693 RepID=A0ABP0L3A0_9DINO